MNSHNLANIELMTQIGFKSQELEDNRNGRLSLQQQQKLQAIQKSWRSFSNLIKVISVILIIASILDGLRTGDTLSNRIGIVILICLVAAAVLISIETKARTYKRDLSKGIVASIEGEVTLTQYMSRRTLITYEIHIARMKFEVSSAIFMSFTEGLKYRLYFAPQSKTLLSVEQLSQDARQA